MFYANSKVIKLSIDRINTIIRYLIIIVGESIRVIWEMFVAFNFIGNCFIDIIHKGLTLYYSNEGLVADVIYSICHTIDASTDNVFLTCRDTTRHYYSEELQVVLQRNNQVKSHFISGTWSTKWNALIENNLALIVY